MTEPVDREVLTDLKALMESNLHQTETLQRHDLGRFLADRYEQLNVVGIDAYEERGNRIEDLKEDRSTLLEWWRSTLLEWWDEVEQARQGMLKATEIYERMLSTGPPLDLLSDEINDCDPM